MASDEIELEFYHSFTPQGHHVYQFKKGLLNVNHNVYYEAMIVRIQYPVDACFFAKGAFNAKGELVIPPQRVKSKKVKHSFYEKVFILDESFLGKIKQKHKTKKVTPIARSSTHTARHESNVVDLTKIEK